MSGTSSSLPSTASQDIAALSLDSTSPAGNSTMHDGLAQVSLDDSLVSLPQPSSSPPSTVISATASSSTTPTRFAAGHIQFRSNTIAPSPPLSRSPTASSSSPSAVRSSSQLSSALTDDPFFRHQPTAPGSCSTTLGGGLGITTARTGTDQSPLRIQTDLQVTTAALTSPSSFAIPITPRNRPEPLNFNAPSSPGTVTTPTSSYARPSALALQHKSSASSLRPISRTPSLKTTGFHGFGSASAASSTVPSPIITAMGDVTPLPSPLLSGDSPGPWRRLRSPQTEAPFGATLAPSESAFVTTNGESISSALAHHAKRKAYAELLSAGGGQRAEGGPAQADLRASHARDRSLSDLAGLTIVMALLIHTCAASLTCLRLADSPLSRSHPRHHRWRWVEYAGDDGDHDGDLAKFQAKGLDGAMELTEGLLKRARSRWTMDKVADAAWVRKAMDVAGGLRFREEEQGEEIL
ncbi:camk protein kinase [Ophiostoma piceae UAMH 11346]|uniref:Camk protein kinase n=1 Tax=Ophiostoma piceae (strain UAMH 11346) TaxID=1262450 RepID=S3CMR9_OPHP1|nr:camk protein kinase [Ophiostoma piceae UAMH 11346]